MKELTRAEEEIMQILWQVQTAFVKDVVNHLPEPRPAYNTVSTFIRILEQKGFVSYKVFGKTHQYFPTVTKTDYRKFVTDKLKASYFGNSVGAMVSFFVENQQIDLNEADEILKLLAKMKNKE